MKTTNTKEIVAEFKRKNRLIFGTHTSCEEERGELLTTTLEQHADAVREEEKEIFKKEVNKYFVHRTCHKCPAPCFAQHEMAEGLLESLTTKQK